MNLSIYMHELAASQGWTVVIASSLISATISAIAIISSALIGANVSRRSVEIASEQSRLANDKIQLELFERRYDAWIILRDSLNSYREGLNGWDGTGPFPINAVNELNAAINAIEFLFGDKIVKQAKTINAKMSVTVSARLAIANAAVGSEKMSALKRWQQSISDEFVEQDKLVELLKNYISLENIGIARAG